MKLQIETHLEPADLMDSVQKRNSPGSVRAGVRTAKKAHRAIMAQRRHFNRAYSRGLPAEQESWRNIIGKLHRDHLGQRSALRAAVLGRRGRPIDITGLLNMRTAENIPIWAIADPRKPLGENREGCIDTDGQFMWGGNWLRYAPGGRGVPRAYQPTGMPPLPSRVRELIRDRNLQRRAARIGILFMPDSWTEVKPDPALVVEWKDIPGKYFALAVWGGDRARIMEWVD